MSRPSLRAELDQLKILPIMTVDEPDVALQTGKILFEAGFRTFEITLRTSAALASAQLIARELPEMRVGLGTVMRREQVAAARDAGAAFIVTPGWTPELAAAVDAVPDLPCLPGASTMSEVMVLAQAGFDTIKWFPANVLGGPRGLAGVSAVVPDLAFCPTGGVGPDSAEEYLALDCVVCVAGSWPCPRSAMAAADWPKLTALARRAFAGR